MGPLEIFVGLDIVGEARIIISLLNLIKSKMVLTGFLVKKKIKHLLQT